MSRRRWQGCARRRGVRGAGHLADLESGAIRAADQRLRSVINLIGNWNLNEAREVAWSTSLALWEARDIPVASDLLRVSLGRTVAATSQLLLVAL